MTESEIQETEVVDGELLPDVRQDDTPAPFVHPLTGEAIDLVDAADDELARFLAGIREHEIALKEAKRIVGFEALRRLDFAGKWTRRAGRYTMKAPSPQPGEEFDEAALREELLQLVDQGVISITAVDEAVEVVVDHKVHKSGINALRKLGGQVKDVVDRHARPVEKARYVTVTEERGR